ncbi:hypothetical protein [Williamsia sterculiae]|uniref:hypothetical protein n=1 Tax=Williamsia sterculiae TaxID=1344003 RepID=UPI00117FFF89|nr:hypothetical protein [Williamsia sterculiae]
MSEQTGDESGALARRRAPRRSGQVSVADLVAIVRPTGLWDAWRCFTADELGEAEEYAKSLGVAVQYFNE